MTNKTTPKDLEYIATHVREWPEATEGVRLDVDGEICFHANTLEHDFYPDNPGADWVRTTIAAATAKYEHPCFLPNPRGGEATGRDYTHSEWLAARKELGDIDHA